MEGLLQQELHDVIDEMNTAYNAVSSYDYINADYADYAVMALGRFRTILNNPLLTTDELQSMLRNAMSEHKMNGAQGCWKGFVANQMANSSNSNTCFSA